MAKSRQYKLTKEGHTYILTAAKHKPSAPKQPIPHVHLNQCVSLFLVRPVPADNETHATLKEMAPLLQEYADIFQTPTSMPPSCHIDHSINLIPGAALPNAPTYRLAPQETVEMERQLKELIDASHIQPSSSPCASIAFVIPKRDTTEMCLVTEY